MGVGDQGAGRIFTVGAAEGDQGGRDAGVAGGGLRDLEHRAVTAPEIFCRAEQVAVGIGN